LIDPSKLDGDLLDPLPPAGWFDREGIGIPEILNHLVNFGWDYLWHCHTLAHEEMDMMHTLVFAVPPESPSGLAAVLAGSGNNKRAVLTKPDNIQFVAVNGRYYLIKECW